MAQPRRLFAAPPPMALAAHAGYCAYISTDEGTVAIRLRPGAAPVSVNNFIRLAREGYYDGLTIDRSCPDAADPTCAGQFVETGAAPGAGSGGPGYSIPREAVKGDYLLGAVAMVSSGDSNSGSRFLISTGDSRALPKIHNLFGQVTDGIPTLALLRKGGRVNWITVLEAAGTTD
ncbi:MAG: peptidylprolyl isomerase [Candidatus Dormibacteraeota bacterium]|nr:peptidylprolyl isomerase [Candidatus Dormibacteraeota bacterium]